MSIARSLAEAKGAKAFREFRNRLRDEIYDKLHGSDAEWWGFVRPIIERRCSQHMFHFSHNPPVDFRAVGNFGTVSLTKEQ